MEVPWRKRWSLLRAGSRWQAGEEVVSDLLPSCSGGVRGGGRLPEQVEAVISEVLSTRYLSRQRRPVAVVHREIARCGRTRGLPAPSATSVGLCLAQAAMTMVRKLPGTTFSNTAQRGAYFNDGNAVLTLRELERWLATAVTCYHGQVHETLGRTPGVCGGVSEKAHLCMRARRNVEVIANNEGQPERPASSGRMCLPEVVPHRPLNLPRSTGNLKSELSRTPVLSPSGPGELRLPSSPETAVNQETFIFVWRPRSSTSG